VFRRDSRSTRSRGQVIVVFVLALTALLLMGGLVIDGGYGLAQARASQNASDFAALAGARIVAESIGGNHLDGTDANVKSAIRSTLAINGAAAPTFSAVSGPVYVDASGATVGWVGNGAIPASAIGVKVSSSRSWRPFFLGIAGIGSWTATADAVAKGGYYTGAPGSVFPAGIAEAFFDGKNPCAGAASGNLGGPGVCDPQQLTPGNLNVPGGFGWLKFGCSGYGLGQVPPANIGGCQPNKPFLQTEIGPPGNSFGCCTQVKLAGSPDFIGSLPGNKASADCSYYITNKVTVTVAVWDYADGNGNNAYYHIVGFTGFQITGCSGGKDIEGVWRQPMNLGPTTTTPGFAGQGLGVQLVR
jgi:hypothetical protein